MNTLSFEDRLRSAFKPTERSVIGLVDDLLGLCQEQGLQLDWNVDHCRVRTIGNGPRESTQISIPRYVFRAILARLAVLCNERTPNSVSPYRGEGELAVQTNPPTVLRVAFANTPGEQRFEIELAATADDGANGADASKGFEANAGSKRHELSG